MYSLFPKKKKKITGKNIRIVFLLLGSALFILSLLCIFFYSFKKDNNLQTTNKKIYIDKSVRNIFEIDYSSSKFNDYEITENESSSNIKISKNIENESNIIEAFNSTYVPIVSWQNFDIINIDYDSLINSIKDGKLNLNGRTFDFIYFDSYKDYYLTIMDSDLKSDSLKSLDGLDSYKNNNDFIALLEIKDMRPYFKHLNIDGVSPFQDDQDEQGKYKFLSSYYLQSDSHEKNETINYLKESIEKYKASIKITDILAVGDIMLSRDVGIKIRKSGDNSLPFRKLYNFLSKADITFGNLESPFYDKGPPLDIGMSFKADPKYIEGIILSGFDVLSLANNHFGNQGISGMEYTFNHLTKNGIKYCGAGFNYNEAHSAAVLERNNINFSFLSYNLISPQNYEAGENVAGLSFLSNNIDSLSQMSKDVKREKNKGNFVVVSFHWGVEYVPNPTDRQKKTAAAAISAGADIIIAQHPHVVQGMDFIDDKPVFYSLGNFIFDQMWSRETREGMMTKVFILDNKIIAFELIPVIIEDYNQPRLSNDDESSAIIKRVIDNSNI